MSNPLPKADVVIIGLGAAGGIAAHVLTKAGINVVGLEAGPRLDNSDFLANDDEISGAVRNWTGAPKFNNEIPTWRPDASSPKGPLPIPPVRMANMVGGTSVHYGTQQWRFREDDFKIRSTTVDKYGEEALPPGSTVADWPVTYADLEPYYDQVEYMIGVSGEAGANPFESPRKRDYPMPPLQRFGYGEMAAQAMESSGIIRSLSQRRSTALSMMAVPPAPCVDTAVTSAAGTIPSRARWYRRSGTRKPPANWRSDRTVG